MENMNELGEAVAGILEGANDRIRILEAALPDPDQLLWLNTWLDQVSKILNAYIEHHDEWCGDVTGGACMDLGEGAGRDKILAFMESEVQDHLRNTARRIKEVQAHG